MNIKIICLGKIKESYLQEGINEYVKRISKYADIRIIELLDEPIPDNPSEKQILEIKEKEADKIRRNINSHDYVCTLDLRRKNFYIRRTCR